jgi:hypothetical protein
VPRTTDFDIAFSFAGEDRAYVDTVARVLRDRGVKVFYDLFEETDLWPSEIVTRIPLRMSEAFAPVLAVPF